jgi:hypothetical protein
MRSFALIALTIIAFAGTIGLPFYTHTCTSENVSISTVFVASDHCDDHEEDIVRTSCCADPSAASISEEDCCSEQLSLLSLSFNFFDYWQMQAAELPQPVFSAKPFILAALPEPEETGLTRNSNAPFRKGREILTRHCVLRL